jgi:hypothetical protein
MSLAPIYPFETLLSQPSHQPYIAKCFPNQQTEKHLSLAKSLASRAGPSRSYISLCTNEVALFLARFEFKSRVRTAVFDDGLFQFGVIAAANPNYYLVLIHRVVLLWITNNSPRIRA